MAEDRRGESLWAETTESILACAFKVQSTLGPGLLESAYEACLAHELRKQGHDVAVQVPLELTYDDLRIPNAYRLDLIVDGKVIVELKAIDQLQDVHTAQPNTYLRLSGHQVGLLLNFWAWPLKKGGIQRVVRSAGHSID
jgi:GxxExxY protein